MRYWSHKKYRLGGSYLTKSQWKELRQYHRMSRNTKMTPQMVSQSIFNQYGPLTRNSSYERK